MLQLRFDKLSFRVWRRVQGAGIGLIVVCVCYIIRWLIALVIYTILVDFLLTKLKLDAERVSSVNRWRSSNTATGFNT